ncbi:protease I [Geodermatophilus obscurus]|uniref:Protease I n=1 Tax=Geodermatophilus obscurus TaxID=1861 RepID=A0A1M7USU3_9ACTN|nr:protease I [Geodermatophilus obscurus]
MAAFVPAMLATFATTAPEPARTAPGHASDPQRNAPPGMAVAAPAPAAAPGAATVQRMRGLNRCTGQSVPVR